MKKPVKQKHVRREVAIKPFVVYVNFPSSDKEYAYLCNTPGTRQGDIMIANNCQVRVVRTAESDPRAVRFVQPLPNPAKIAKQERRKEIVKRLREIDVEVSNLEIWQKLARKNTEAKRLVAEYKRLGV